MDDEHRTTHIYIEKDSSIVEDVQLKVIGLLRKLVIKTAEKKKKETSIENAA